MPDQTAAQVGGATGGSPTAQIPQILGDSELYDRLMGAIEPELTTSQLPTLDAKYKGETPEQWRIRAARYAKAVDEYKRQLAAYGQDWDGKLHAFERYFQSGLEQNDRNDDTADLGNLEAAIQNT